MTKSPDEINPDKAPALAAMQAIKFEEDSPYGKSVKLNNFSLVLCITDKYYLKLCIV